MHVFGVIHHTGVGTGHLTAFGPNNFVDLLFAELGQRKVKRLGVEALHDPDNYNPQLASHVYWKEVHDRAKNEGIDLVPLESAFHHTVHIAANWLLMDLIGAGVHNPAQMSEFMAEFRQGMSMQTPQNDAGRREVSAILKGAEFVEKAVGSEPSPQKFSELYDGLLFKKSLELHDNAEKKRLEFYAAGGIHGVDAQATHPGTTASFVPPMEYWPFLGMHPHDTQQGKRAYEKHAKVIDEIANYEG